MSSPRLYKAFPKSQFYSVLIKFEKNYCLTRKTVIIQTGNEDHNKRLKLTEQFIYGDVDQQTNKQFWDLRTEMLSKSNKWTSCATPKSGKYKTNNKKSVTVCDTIRTRYLQCLLCVAVRYLFLYNYFYYGSK